MRESASVKRECSMLKEQAKEEALRRWRALPKRERTTTDQADTFAMRLAMSGHIRFLSSGDLYLHIKG